MIETAEDLQLKSRAIDETPFGVTIADMRRDDAPIIYANEGFSRITGYPEDEVLGRNCRFLQGDGTGDEPVRLMREAIGLYIANQLVENYGGTLSLADESTPETDLGGATFVVRLPLVE